MNDTKHNPKYFGIGPPRTFDLVRLQDVSGISGTGIVAEGCVFSDGTTALRWLTEHRSTVVYESAREALAIHGHGGATIFRYHGFKEYGFPDGSIESLACSNCAHAWGDHDGDGASICNAGGCSCCLMEHPEFKPVGHQKHGHCNHPPKCIGVGEPDERDPLGCCNCGTREMEEAQKVAKKNERKAFT